METAWGATRELNAVSRVPSNGWSFVTHPRAASKLHTPVDPFKVGE